MSVEIIEQLSGSSSPRPWSIVAGESGEGVIGDANGVEIAGASMADCAVIVRAVNSHDTLIRQRAADVEAINAVQALHAQAVAERDEARRQVEAMREVLHSIAVGYDHEEDAHRYNNGACRVCQAQDVLDALAVPSTNGGG